MRTKGSSGSSPSHTSSDGPGRIACASWTRRTQACSRVVLMGDGYREDVDGYATQASSGKRIGRCWDTPAYASRINRDSDIQL
ncbi:hypothetical protein NSPZN2_90016 [Nitrospira defluvii]|uniref:Uncharacterized protein n=1 Tax=Nitrospira defluvii TaxID=330214 RepID=A0ABN7MJ73_9BACT|nr:hypothetical protein NSPZN2_90016 [Nitrospira defluvii]